MKYRGIAAMGEYVLIFEMDEKQAVKSGELDGDVYRDGSVYANKRDLEHFRNLRALREIQSAS
jgi:hypothetical protein